MEGAEEEGFKEVESFLASSQLRPFHDVNK